MEKSIIFMHQKAQYYKNVISSQIDPQIQFNSNQICSRIFGINLQCDCKIHRETEGLRRVMIIAKKKKR